MSTWVEYELLSVDLGDARLNKRLMKLVNDFAANPGASIPYACGEWSATKAAYRFFDSERVKPEDIRDAHRQSTIQRVKNYKTVLILQDTTNLDFTNHPHTKNIGYLDNILQRGLKVHSTIAATTDGVPLGLIHQEILVRDPQNLGKRHQRHKRDTKDKESQRWLTALQKSQDAVPEEVHIIIVADREADIYDLFAAPRRPGVDLLIRGTHNRRVNCKSDADSPDSTPHFKAPNRKKSPKKAPPEDEKERNHLWDAIHKSPIKGELTIQLQRANERQPRQATLAIRYQTLEIIPPRNRRHNPSLKPVPVQVVLAEEKNAPLGEAPLRWMLITTLPVTTLEEATRCILWYSRRWLVERYHFVLKSGCRVEDLQLETGERIQRALATYCIVAWRLLWLTYESRQNPELPCDRVLEPHEWQSLYCIIHKTAVPPDTPPTLHQAVRWIAKLGGFLGRKGDKEPGVVTIWRGLQRLYDIAETWRLLHPPVSPKNSDTYG